MPTTKILTTVTCRRCGGSGEYAYNPRDGKVCYGCSGTRTQLVDLEAEAANAARKAKDAARNEAKRLARFEHAETERDRLVAVLCERYPAEGARLLEGLARGDYLANDARVGLHSFGNSSRTVDETAAWIGRWDD